MDTSSHSIRRKHKKPSFFKILINDFSTRLQIPPAFAKKFGKQIANKTMIEACNEKSWEVEVQKLGEILCFSKGWGNFVEENKLEYGDFLIFKFLGESKFKVTVYGKTCCVKQFPAARERNSELVSGKDQEQEDQGKRKRVEVDDDDDCNKDEQLKGAERNSCEFEKAETCEGDNVILIDSDTSDEKTGVLKQTTKAPDGQIKFYSQYPFFQVKLNSSNINGGYLYIPKSFREHMKMKKEQQVKFKICKEYWSMGLQFIYERRRNEGMREIRICQGWRLFVKTNDLKMGDVCIFEMITSDDHGDGDGDDNDDDDDDVIFIVHVHRWDGAKSEFIKIF